MRTLGRQIAGAEPTGGTPQQTIQIPAGNRLTITLRSDDEDMGGSGNPSPEGVT
jgi:hypothetical protein